MPRPKGAKNVPKRQKSEKAKLADEIKAFKGLVYYNKLRLMRSIDRLHLNENIDRRLQAGAELLTVILELNELLYASDLEVKSLLGLETKLL